MTPETSLPPTTGPGARPVVFRTAGVPSAERIARWESHNADALVALTCSPVGGAALDAAQANLRLEHFDLARIVGSPHAVQRTTETVRRAPADAVACYLSLRGEAVFSTGASVQRLRPGQLIVCDTDRPFLRGFTHGLDELALKVPRTVFHELTGQVEVSAPVVIDFGSGRPAARTLANLLTGALRGGDGPPFDEEGVLQLFAHLATGTCTDTALLHLTIARGVIEEQLGDPRLSVARIASETGISERHLSRVFATSGASVPHYVLTRRLDRARSLLETGTPLSVAELAAHTGFGSVSYFSRAFHDRFDERATDVRRRARSAPGA